MNFFKSDYPVAYALKCSFWCETIKTQELSFEKEFHDMANYFTSVALAFVTKTQNNHAAMVMLECDTDLEPTTSPPVDAFTIAVRTNNGKFLSNSKYVLYSQFCMCVCV